jgi:glycosyltransferase 2 family protein
LLLFSARWWFIMRAFGVRIPYGKLSAIRLAGYAISYFSPGTQFGGEPLQVYLVNSQHQVSTPTAIASVTLDKLWEIIANFTFLVTGVLLTLRYRLIPGMASPNAAVWISVLLALPLVYFGSLWFGLLPLTKSIVFIPKRMAQRALIQKLSSVAVISEKQIAGLVRQQPLLILWITLLSGLVWVLMIVEYWLMVNYLGAPISPLQAVAGLTASRLAFLSPLPGGVGLLEASQVLAMEAFGYTAAFGITVSLLIRARDLAIGLISFWLGAVGTQQSTRQLRLENLAAEAKAAQASD